MWRVLVLALAIKAEETTEESSKKILGSSVVTSVSVIMDAGNGSKVYSDAVGKPLPKPHSGSELASPINLLNPDRYEFYTFDDTGDLVKRLMTLEEIQNIVAVSGSEADSLNPPEKRVNDVVNNVQNVLKEEIKLHQAAPNKPQLDTPDVSGTWSMILPAIFGNSGDEIKPDISPIQHVTPETIMLEPTVLVSTTEQISTTQKLATLQQVNVSTTMSTTTEPASTIQVEIITHSNSTTNSPESQESIPVVEIKPQNYEPPLPRITTDEVTSSTEIITTTTSEEPVGTTKIAELPSLLDVLNEYSNLLKEQMILESTTVASPSTTTLSPSFTTTLIPNPTTTINPTTEDQTTINSSTQETTSAGSTIYTSSESKDISTWEILDDLSTLSSEYPLNKFYNDTATSTTENQPSTLNQFLLSSTNIYEINSELADIFTTVDDFSNESTTTITTANEPLIETIDRFIYDATDGPGTTPETVKESALLEKIINSSANKTMEEVVLETATLASHLLAPFETSQITTTAEVPTETTTSTVTTTVTPTTTIVPELETTVLPTLETTSTTPKIPHIINITIIRHENRTKPAKADLSLEVDYQNIVNEMQKNATISTTTEPIENKTKTSSWMLVSTVLPPTTVYTAAPVDLVPKPMQGYGLEDSTAKLDADIYQFVQLCNELAFGYWKSVTATTSTARSIITSPFAATSLLAMVFLGARGSTSGEMNEILKLDDMVTFNPHLIFKNVTESIKSGEESGVAASAIVRELFSDKNKGTLLGFYKARVRQFYDGHVEEIGFREVGDKIRRRTNLLVKRVTHGKVSEFIKDVRISPKPPLVGISASILYTDCTQASTSGRDGELHFVVLPSVRQRRLIPIPAVVYKSGFLAGYDPGLDATAAAIGSKDQIISTILVIPGQQGITPPGDGLARLEKRLNEASFKKGVWSNLLRSLIPRPGLELQIPRFQHRSYINATSSLKKMGLTDLFDSRKADLKGLNGVAHELFLSDVLQINEFATCGEKRIGETHHKEIYPSWGSNRKSKLIEEWEEPRDYQRAFDDPLHDPDMLSLPLQLRPRQARLPENPRLRFDRPFLYFIRHNPSGLILHIGRFHPRLLP